MPTYQYHCRDCDQELETVQSFTDDALTTCPSCKGSLRKVFAAPGISFKGSGFYKNDSRGAKSSSNGSSEASKDKSDSATSSESTSSTADKSEKADKSDKSSAKSTTTPSSDKGSSSAKSGAKT